MKIVALLAVLATANAGCIANKTKTDRTVSTVANVVAIAGGVALGYASTAGNGCSDDGYGPCYDFSGLLMVPAAVLVVGGGIGLAYLATDDHDAPAPRRAAPSADCKAWQWSYETAITAERRADLRRRAPQACQRQFVGLR